MSSDRRPPYIDDTLFLGYRFDTYLFFELPPALSFSRIVRASLILYKIPLRSVEPPPQSRRGRYCVSPLLDFFSIFSNWYQPPRVAGQLTVGYSDRADCSYTEVDITTIADAWIAGKLENKGLSLTSAPNAPTLAYASDRYEIAGMRPTLRLIYEGSPRPLSAASCTVEVE